MWGDLDLRIVNLNNVLEFSAVKNFLERFSLSFDRTVEYTIAVYVKDEVVGVGLVRRQNAAQYCQYCQSIREKAIRRLS